MIKGTIQQEAITLVNIYAPNIGEPKYVHIDGHKGRDGQKYRHSRGFNTPLSSMNKSSRQKINKETAALNDTLD